MRKTGRLSIPESLSAILVAGLVLVSCSLMEDPQTGAFGYLELPEIGIDVSIDNLPQTKALDFTVAVPSSDDVTYIIKNSQGASVETVTGGWTGQLTLAAGSYTIEASAGNEGFGDPYSGHIPYYTGKADFTVSKLEVSKPSLTLTVASALVRVTVGNDLAGHFTPGTDVTLLCDGADAVAKYGKWYYVPVGKPLKVSLPGTNSVGNPATFTYDLPSPAAKTAYNVICGKDASWPSISIDAAAFAKRVFVAPATVANVADDNKAALVYEVSESSDFSALKPVTAVSGVNGVACVADGITGGTTYYVRARIGNIVSESVEVKDGFSAGSVSTSHFNDGSGNLAGTNAVLDYKFPQGGLLERLYNNGKGVLKIDASLLRTGVSGAVRTSSSAKGTMGGDTVGWPYLPQSYDGSAYTLSVTQTLSGTHPLTAQATGITVPAPTFTVTLGPSYTSYDKGVGFNGITKNVAEANSSDPETLYKVSASWKISSALMSNTNYSKSLKFYTNDVEKSSQTPTGNSCSEFNISGLTTWQKYTLKASMTFDGATATATKDHHITGLPYTANPPKNLGNYPWSSSGNVKWDNSEYVHLWPANGNGEISFDHFYIPNSFNVSVSHSYTMTDSNIIWHLKSSFSLGTTSFFSELALDNVSSETTAGPYDATISSSNKKIIIKASYNALNRDTFYHNVYQVDVDYRN